MIDKVNMEQERDSNKVRQQAEELQESLEGPLDRPALEDGVSLAETKTPAAIADGGVTPANIRARGAEPGTDPRMPEAARAARGQTEADDAGYHQVGNEPASAGKHEQPGAMGGDSAGRVSSRQGSGTRGTRTLVPIPG